MPSNIRRQEEPYPSALCDAPQGCEKPADYRHGGKCHGEDRETALKSGMNAHTGLKILKLFYKSNPCSFYPLRCYCGSAEVESHFYKPDGDIRRQQEDFCTKRFCCVNKEFPYDPHSNRRRRQKNKIMPAALSGKIPIYDVILMDIQMKKMDGMTAAREIRKTDSEVILVFITNMVQYAVNGYAVNAIDYILKPLNYFTFAEHMKRIENHLENKLKNYLILNTNGGILKIDTNEIYYMESLGHYIHIHKKKEVISVLETMKNMEQALSGFFRCNNGYLVNLAYVEKVDKYTALVGNDEIQISRPRKKIFMEALTDYLGGMAK